MVRYSTICHRKATF